MLILAALLVAVGVYLSLYVLYQLLLFAANAFIPDRPVFEPLTIRRFNVLVPAHNEELYVGRLLASLASQDYPKARFRVTVVADNCTDGTLAACKAFDVEALDRVDPSQRGKGYAIRWALERIGLDRFDAVVILDGDSQVNAGFLTQLNLQLERGDRVIQTYNGVANPDESWFTRLMDISETMANEILFPGKIKLGLSCHLLGNGMCFDVQVLRSQGWNAFSVGEDWEYYAKLALNGVSVGYTKFAQQFHQESADLEQASSQRIRWAGGRFQVLREYGPALLMRAVRTRSLKALDACLPLAFPNASLAMNLTFLGLGGAALYWLAASNVWFAIWYLSLAGAELAMFGMAILRTRNKAANAASLVLAPLFLGWKLGIDIVSFCGAGTKEWKRTERRLS